MIRSTSQRNKFRRQWSVVRKLSTDAQQMLHIPGAGLITERRLDEAFNLPLVLAYAVLDQVLSELENQGVFSTPGKHKYPPLGKKMMASQAALPWKDFQLVSDGKDTRNKIAHEAVLCDRFECLKYIAALEAELVAWRIVAAS